MKLLITGGCGFIGSHFVRMAVSNSRVSRVVNLDALTYAGKLENLEGLDEKNYRFVKGSICGRELVEGLFKEFDFDAVVNFAAESHVDNSILGPRVFFETNVSGTINLLDLALNHWKKSDGWKEKRRFLQVSTDEVYGSLPENDPSMKFTERSPLEPSSPYSASKAAADLVAAAYHRTFGMPVLITRCSNNYGPCQDAEKLIPLLVTRAMEDQKLPIYGDGKNVRDWLYVEDHCAAVWTVLEKARPGSVYNIGGSNERRNIEIAKKVLAILGKPEALIEYVTDRPGHDRRYAIDSSLIQKELGWRPAVGFEQGLEKTVRWYEGRRQRKGAKHVRH